MRTVNFYFSERENNQKLVRNLLEHSEGNSGYIVYPGMFKDSECNLGKKEEYSHHLIIERGVGVICSREGGFVQIAVQDGNYNLQETLIDLSSLSNIPRKKFIPQR